MKDIIAGYHIFLAREGAVIDGVTVADDAKPDTSPESNYTRVAHCESFEPRRTGNRLVRRSPDPGRFQDRAVIITNQQIEYVLGLQEWSDMTLAEGLLGGSAPVAGVFVPNGATEDIRGWFLIQGYDHENNQILALNVWGEARVEPYTFGENLTAYRFIVRQLSSTLNTGEVSNLS
ncbi:hypothetical protein OKA04_23470 [Luteolibacter flavescens]|uniref:Uncharacterized protein n=1 Tax=Luteolibacter flavescens TaxID=1859460 RepID=A0ABT3FVY8_9BACT|nr:hypothetical protein [Luteolibacter flavescens]MCW1887717.1 hypothetical protein [Luteolibacter flavescens]